MLSHPAIFSSTNLDVFRMEQSSHIYANDESTTVTSDKTMDSSKAFRYCNVESKSHATVSKSLHFSSIEHRLKYAKC